MHRSLPPAVKPLTGIRVVDFSRLLPGGYCTWLLAALGAEIIKVEQPGKGDYQRDIGLQYGLRGGALFQLVNQGKRSIGIDLKRAEARPILKALLESADVIVESFRPGVAVRLGIDFQLLRKERPALVCVSINGFGSSSPLSMRAAHDINYLALSGLAHRQLLAGEGIPDLPLVDLIGGGLIPALSVLALLFRARLTGIGGTADPSLADALCLLPYEVLAAALLGRSEPVKEESDHSGMAPYYSIYALSDGYLAVGAVEEPFWHTFCQRLQLRPTPSSASRQQNDALRAEIARRLRAMSRSEAEALFEGVDACATVVQSYEHMLASPQARARDYVCAAASLETMPRLGSPFFHDGQRASVPGVAPGLGEHSFELLQELGFAPSMIQALTTTGVLTHTEISESNGHGRTP